MAPNLRKRPRPTTSPANGTYRSSATKTKRQKNSHRQNAFKAEPSREDLHTVFDLIEARANDPEINNKPILYYPSTGTEYVGHTPRDIYNLTSKAATYYSEIIPPRESSEGDVEIVALLGRSTFDYLVALLGVSRLGYALLFLSPRISEEAHQSLLEKSGASYLLVGDGLYEMGNKLQGHFPNLPINHIAALSKYVDLPLFVPGENLKPQTESQHLAWIIHSSGSTSLPKPVRISHTSALGNFKSVNNLVSLVTLPLFHAQGIGFVFRGIMNKKPVYMYPGELPLTTTHLVKTLREHSDIQMLLTVPYTCRLLAESDEGIALCKRLELLFSGGALCPKPIGDKLAQAGINLVSHWGSTETGQLMNSFRAKSETLEWDWLRPLEGANPFVRWEPYDEANGIFELVVTEGWPAKVASNRDDGAYATSDLWERHPEYPKVNKWRYHARKDDTLVLVNGEKANPVLFEQLACESPFVQEAIVFGGEKPKLGIFVLPTDFHAVEQEVRRDVWPAIESANMKMPAHAQIDRDMIKILSPEEADRIRRTDKRNIIRGAFYKDFAPVIDACYEIALPTEKVKLSREELLTFLRSEILFSLSLEHQNNLKDGTDLFSLGIDSLQVSRVRSAMIKKGIDTGHETIGENFVFEFPSITAMADELIRMHKGELTTQLTTEDRMQALIEKYSFSFEPHRPADESGPASTIVVTGATGSLGTHLVAQISFWKDVEEVVCFVRASSDDQALDRVRKSLAERRVEADWNKISAYASDFSDVHLGLPSELYEAIAGRLKCVFHCAWNVNFNMSLESFERDCIQGTRYLIDLCLQARTERPAEFVFCSSVSAASDDDAREIPEDLPSSLKAAQSTGYAQSKLVAEHLCLRASKTTGITSKVLRIGQIAGDTTHGIWNPNEAITMMLKSAATIGSLPMLDEWCSWLPVDAAAKTILDIAFKKETECGIFNVLNPRRFHWTWDLLISLRAMGVQFKAEDRHRWLEKLRSVPDPIKNPPYKLVDFFQAKYRADDPAAARIFVTEKTQALSSSLKHVTALDQRMLCRVVERILGD